MGFKRSEARMREIEIKLRRGMEQRGITGDVQDRIVQAITSFALYGFPESHAASFALIAYASAWLKCHHRAAFTAALLNNQPMGFYHPSTLVKDVQRHGLKVKPIDVTRSDWPCTIESGAVRIGLSYAKGLREQAARAIVTARPFASIDELARRVPLLHKDELERLAEIGALNSIGAGDRRDALWQVERAARRPGPLLEELPEEDAASPLARMTPEERLLADYRGAELTVGRHPMAFRRAELDRLRVTRACDLARVPNGRWVRAAGVVICRQRPGTASGFLFLSLEDETGIANAIVTPDLFERFRSTLVNEPFLLVEGTLQNQDNVISVKARRVGPLVGTAVGAVSHDFH
jgi:error-prone DNA polymerase